MFFPKTLKPAVYIDALALVPVRKSGVGYTLEQLLLGLSTHISNGEAYDIYLVVPLGKAKYLQEYLGPRVKTKTVFLPARVLKLLLELHLMPSMDWFIGTGVYIFPNYRNWPLWRSRALTYVYDVSFVRFPELVQPKNEKYIQRNIARWVSRSDKVLTITQEMRQEIEKYLSVPYTKIDVVYCGVDATTFYRRAPAIIRQTKRKYGIPFDQYMLFVGNIEPRKNLVRLLEAYQNLPTKLREQYGLVFIGGDGWLNEEFAERLAAAQAAGQKVLKVKDYVASEDLPALYSGAEALVHPALYEGFGLPPLEAMACETPVVVSDIPAIREVVRDCGIYCDPTSVASITDALEEVLTNKSRVNACVVAGKVRAKQLSWMPATETLAGIIDKQFQVGNRVRPILARLKGIYKYIDIRLRELLGDKSPEPFTLPVVEDKAALRTFLYQNFFDEQPTRLQTLLLSGYLQSKHILGAMVRKMISGSR